MLLRIITLALLLTPSVFASPNIVVSIQPIHSIVSAITHGVTTPKLLLETHQSPHHTHLKPSQLSMLSAADLVIMIHPKFETGLQKIARHIPADKKIIINSDTGSRHSWLEVARMQLFSQKLTQKLIEIDRGNADIYQKNLAQLMQQLTKLEQNIKQQLADYQSRSIALSTDVFKYFIQSHLLQTPLIIGQSHGHRLSIYQIRIAKEAMKKNHTKCLISTTDMPDKRLRILREGLAIKLAKIDVMGIQIPLNAQHYFKLMHKITQQIAQCLT